MKNRTIWIMVALHFLVGILTGCATITKGTKDALQVQITNCSEAIPCTATNKKGSWDFTAPGPVRFKKSDESLTITCKDGPENLTVQIAPVRGAMAWGNIVFGGIIGGGVDSGTDAHWDTVDSLNISRGYCNGKPLN